MMKRAIIILLSLSLIISMSACKKGKNKKVEEVTYSQQDIDALTQQVNQLKDELSIYDSTYLTKNSFANRSVLSSGVMEFNKIDDKIVLEGEIFSDDISVPGALQTSVSMGSNIKIDTINWTVRTSADKVDLSLQGQAYGKIYTKKYTDEFWSANSVGLNFINPYLEFNGITINKTNGIYINGTQVGEESLGAINIIDSTTKGKEMSVPGIQIMDEMELKNWKLDKESEINISLQIDESAEIPATIRCGAAKIGDVLICYEFIQLNENGNRAVNSLLQGIKINNSSLYIN